MDGAPRQDRGALAALTTDAMSRLPIKVSRGSLGAEELAQVAEAFEYGYFGLAYKVSEFERELSRFLGAPLVVACSSGTAALHMAVDALGLGAGDEVLVPSLTFVACFQAIAATGATPVPCDVLAETLLIDVADARRRLTARTKAIMPVHYAGNPCDMPAVFELARQHRLRVIEDAAHAFGSSVGNRRVGSTGDIVCFSFDSIKTITCGEGGAVVCPDEAFAERIREKRLLGMQRPGHASASWKERGWRFDVLTLGFRYHMSNINAGIGLAQLKKADAFIRRRRAICRAYDQAFSSRAAIRTLPLDYDHVAPHVYVIRVDANERDALMAFLKSHDIETGINYIPNHHHQRFRSASEVPVSDRAFREMLTLPLHTELSDADVSRVIDRVLAFVDSKALA